MLQRYAPSNPTVIIFESMEVQIGLAERLAYLKSSISQSEWKYFHLDSIDNFIFHLPNIENERTRVRVTEKLAEYLDVVDQKSKDHFNPIESYKNLNRTYIWPISHFFTDELDFIQKPDYLLFIVLVIAVTLVLLLALPWTITLFIVTTFVLWKVIRDRLY